jgi:hypothetical protein
MDEQLCDSLSREHVLSEFSLSDKIRLVNLTALVKDLDVPDTRVF